MKEQTQPTEFCTYVIRTVFIYSHYLEKDYKFHPNYEIARDLLSDDFPYSGIHPKWEELNEKNSTVTLLD